MAWRTTRRFRTTAPSNFDFHTDDDDPFLRAWTDQLPPRGTSSTAFPSNGFHFYLCCNSRTDSTAAPTDGDSLMVLCPTPPLDEDADDKDVDEWITLARTAVFRRLEASAGAAIAPHVIHEKVIDPWECGMTSGYGEDRCSASPTVWTN